MNMWVVKFGFNRWKKSKEYYVGWVGFEVNFKGFGEESEYG